MKKLCLFLLLYSAAMAQTDSLKTVAADSTKKKVVVDTVTYVQARAFSESGFHLADSTFFWNDSRYFADFFNNSGLSFNRSLGTAGQPEEMTLYGMGKGMVSMFEDGELANDRSTGAAEVNTVQGEGVESIEIVPLNRGFLYGPFNNPVSVNARSISSIVPIPYTRIRYYQAPFLEAFFDFRQQQMFAKKLYFALQVTNRKKDEGYAASGSSSWLASLQLMYPITNKLTIGGTYRFAKFAPSLFGGVDMDSVAKLYKNPTPVLYDELLAPAATPERYFQRYQNSFAVTARYMQSSMLFHEAVAFSRESVTFFRMNMEDTVISPNRISKNLISKSNGFRLRHDFTSDILTISIQEGYEQASGADISQNGRPEYTAWYVSGLLSFFPHSVFSPSVYAKASGLGSLMQPGFGADCRLIISPELTLTAGLSAFQRENNIQQNEKITFVATEAKLRYHYSPKEYYQLIVYNLLSNDAVGSRQILTTQRNTIVPATYAEGKYSLLGYSFTGIKYFGNISVETAFGGSMQSEEFVGNKSLPTISGQLGVYYNNVHFDSSLFIKTGFKTSFYSAFTPALYDVFYNYTYSDSRTSSVPANGDLSFFMAAEIKKLAIVYFSWENLLDRQYYLTPYYPMPRRGLRFGLTWQLFN